MASDKLTVRSPTPLDLKLAVKDVVTLRAAPPAMFALLVLAIAANPIFAVCAVALTSYLDALWSRILTPIETKPE